MTRRGPTTVASPVLVGAVTILVTIVAVFLAYNANNGLPFVPTYDIKAELPSGGKLVKGNEVRVGGFRVGIVRNIEPAYRQVAGKRRAIALVDLQLDKRVEPLATDSRLRVRPRSALGGLKYIELTPGRSSSTVHPGETIPLAQTSESRDVEDIANTFTAPTREHLRDATVRFGDALTGRGPALNEAIGALNPMVRHLLPVMRALSDRATRLREFLPQLEGTLAQIAPEARTFSMLFTDAADTFDAFSRDPAALGQTIERFPPTLDVATRSFRHSRPVLAALSDLERRLLPSVQEMPRTLPPLNRALLVGTPVLPRTVGLSKRLGSASSALLALVRNPNTLLSLRDVRTALAELRPLFTFIAPYQTVCNYTIYFLNPLGEHQSQPGAGGTVEVQFLKFPNRDQPNGPTSTFNSRPWDLPPGQPAQNAMFNNNPAGRVLGTPYYHAIDAQGNADCQNGQFGYPNGRLLASFARKNHQGSDPNDPNDIVFGTLKDGTPAGENAAVVINNYPGLSGGTYKSRQLHIRNLRDVP